MTHSLISFLSILSIFFIYSTGYKNNNVTANNTRMTSNRLIIKIGSNTFNATLSDNPTATGFKALLPLTVEMKELNGKHADLSKNLVTNSSNPRNIQSGDLMLYGSNTLVLFYQSFSTSYSYTRIGLIKDATRLTAAVGSGKVTVTFELE